MLTSSAALAMPTELIPLTLLRPGQAGQVDQILGAGDVVHRLREMGLRDGSTVEMLRTGSPCIVRLDGQKLGLRSDELAGVLVRAGDDLGW